MLIERAAYGNRWRRVTPAAKGAFALAGLIAAFAAPTPASALLVALLLAGVACLGPAWRPRFICAPRRRPSAFSASPA